MIIISSAEQDEKKTSRVGYKSTNKWLNQLETLTFENLKDWNNIHNQISVLVFL